MDYRTSVDFCLDALGGKWKVLILAQLFSTEGGIRLTDILDQVPGLGRRVLIRELRELELAEVISREDFDEKPPRVEYQLTEHGRALEPIVTSMHEWGLARIERLKAELTEQNGDEQSLLLCAQSFQELDEELAKLDPEILAELAGSEETKPLAKRSKELLSKLGKKPGNYSSEHCYSDEPTQESNRKDSSELTTGGNGLPDDTDH